MLVRTSELPGFGQLRIQIPSGTPMTIDLYSALRISHPLID
jgi:hypothetical protein